MLKTKMTVRFYAQAGDPNSVSLRYRMDPARELRPAFKLGEQLFSGSIVTDEEALYSGMDYPVQVWFRTIYSAEVYSMVEKDLHTGTKYNIQIASRKIGEAVLLDYCFEP